MVALTAAAPVCLRVAEPEDVGAFRREVHKLAIALGADEVTTGRAELAATELASNLLRHATGSRHALAQPLLPHQGRGLELLSVDDGPGLADLGHALEYAASQRAAELAAGKSPVGRSLGCGLAAVRRSASEFEGYSRRGQGTVLLARFVWGPPQPAAFACAGVSVPMVLGDDNGDGWAFVADEDAASVLVVDGLGHGPEAARAARAAMGAFEARPPHRERDLEGCLREIHAAMRGTRGGVASVCTLDRPLRQFRFAGIGNVEGRVHGLGDSVGLAPRTGTLGDGSAVTKVPVREGSFEPGTTLILYSDGVRTHFDLADYPGLTSHDPSVIAAALHRDLRRGRDDSTLVVVQDARLPHR
jgi:anti-sigma regulatory factor (Ser/Thr protein kinase)